ncbi:aspartate aminotransferase family protein [Nocardia puris]|uniref:Taurine--2-oxoglutarate transaminase n=1 Tax=Nocardia puris TaxID=208602 RepID=A0A366D939_9NOCA|nr:aspartate aminotransferase family protein [Nocardia puris]MBF6214053.1 aspartate aminotransferase family protein [Nocardia puris]MBF6368663.1 aspartate aminotransferase family protein [Nocardia puris]MBF6461565.1 aspartate aminotransferase family protein [Nocardia puris]RBO86560.1 taurine--2-oxoglutarate transaminase [Nocardia puris]
MTAVGIDLDARAYELDRAHVFHSWSAQAALNPLVLAGGRGCRVWDHAGREYLDFASQMVNVNIGHQHPVVTAAIADQAARLTTIGPAVANLQRGEAAQRITALAPEGFDKVFFTNGGADANENAIRMARLHTGRDKVLSTYRSYHGNTGAAVVATGDWRRMPNEYARGHVHFFGPYLYRSEFWSSSAEEESERALRHLERVVQCEGPDTIAAILLESVPGTAGILVPPPGYLAGVRAIADRYGIVLILDEVMCGFGRTGRWFAFDGYDVIPDLITFAKGVNSGYVPVGGVVISEPIARTFDERVFPGGLTYSGHPLAAASIVAALDVMADEGIVANAERIGRTVIGPALSRVAEDVPLIGEVRGEGVFWAIELVADRETRQPLSAAAMARIKADLVARGVLPFLADNRIHFAPPCVVTEAEVHEAAAALREVLTALPEEIR